MGCCASPRKPQGPVSLQDVLDADPVKLVTEEAKNHDVETTTANDISCNGCLPFSSEEQHNQNGDLNINIYAEGEASRTNDHSEPAKENFLSIYDNNVSFKKRKRIIQETFKAMDTKGDGTISFTDFSRHVVEDLGMSDDEATEMFKDIGRALTDRISLCDFDTYSRDAMSKEAKAHFLKIAGQDRVIDHKEWLKYCKKIKMKKREMKRIWDQMDEDKSGKVTYTEFDNYVTQELLKKDHDSWFLS